MLLESPELLERHDSMYSVVSKSIRGVGSLQPEQDTGGQASIASEVAIMAKNMIGCGSLSLSHGIALCANTTNAIWAGNFWILASVNVIVNFHNPSWGSSYYLFRYSIGTGCHFWLLLLANSQGV